MEVRYKLPVIIECAGKCLRGCRQVGISLAQRRNWVCPSALSALCRLHRMSAIKSVGADLLGREKYVMLQERRVRLSCYSAPDYVFI